MDTNLIIWAAGFLDGEGTITIKRFRSLNKKSSVRYQAYVSCGQVNKPEQRKAILRLKKLFGGGVCDYIQPANGYRLDTIAWQVASLKAEACVKRILPYLLVKKPQAEVLLAYCKAMKRNGPHKLMKKEIAKRDRYWHKMRKLNVKGKLRLQRLNEETP